jgi:hypothetical protein
MGGMMMMRRAGLEGFNQTAVIWRRGRPPSRTPGAGQPRRNGFHPRNSTHTLIPYRGG